MAIGGCRGSRAALGAVAGGTRSGRWWHSSFSQTAYNGRTTRADVQHVFKCCKKLTWSSPTCRRAKSSKPSQRSSVRSPRRAGSLSEASRSTSGTLRCVNFSIVKIPELSMDGWVVCRKMLEPRRVHSDRLAQAQWVFVRTSLHQRPHMSADLVCSTPYQWLLYTMCHEVRLRSAAFARDRADLECPNPALAHPQPRSRPFVSEAQQGTSSGPRQASREGVLGRWLLERRSRADLGQARSRIPRRRAADLHLVRPFTAYSVQFLEQALTPALRIAVAARSRSARGVEADVRGDRRSWDGPDARRRV